jgi:hypothetical protein
MPRNPSELARLEEELKELKQELKNPTASKAYKEGLLRDIRKIEGQLGFANDNYNGGK